MSITNEPSTEQSSGDQPLNERVEAERITRDMSYKQLVTAFELEDEVSLPALRRWLKGETIQAQHLVIPAAQRWLGELQEPRNERKTTPFVETRLANQVMSALTWAKAHNEMVAVIGEPGLGKTRSIRQVQATYEDVWVATMDPTVAGLVSCLQAV
ncbi:MAG TPA: hypothetical protein VN764_18470, partial [Polyangiaceae bacterium]|nr:hypothetical protein [Polyangiaceae bacterium]